MPLVELDCLIHRGRGSVLNVTYWNHFGIILLSQEQGISVLPLISRGTAIKSKRLIFHFFSSVAYVWAPGAKSTGPIVKKFGFS
jgi:hypothetical protein